MVSKRAVFPVLICAAVLSGLVACGGGSDSPTTPPTPRPTAVPTPTPTPVPTPPLPAGMVCSPTPPPLYGLNVKFQVGTRGRKTLDSRPQVINMDGYCESVGFGSGFFCFTRREGDPQAVACDYMAVGQATDTGRWGPTWSADGKPCTENNDIPGCQNHPENQFLVIAKGDGVFQACVADYIPLSTNPDRPGSRCGTCRIENGQNQCQ
jgi:hypothetical protein